MLKLRSLIEKYNNMLKELKIKASISGILQRWNIPKGVIRKSSLLLLFLLSVCANPQEDKPIFAPVVYIKDVLEKTILRVPPEFFYHDSLSAYNARITDLRVKKPNIVLEIVIERVMLVSPNGIKVSKKK